MPKSNVIFLFPEMERKHLALERVRHHGRRFVWCEDKKTGKIFLHDFQDGELPRNTTAISGKNQTKTAIS